MLFSTIVVVPLSSVIIKDNSPYRYFINKRDKLRQDSDACDKIVHQNGANEN
jgi:hypothetical protein